jgi:endonuclease G
MLRKLRSMIPKRAMRFTALILPLLFSPAFAWDQLPNKPITDCAADLPFGVPSVSTPNTTLECRQGYALQHDNVAKIPVWVGWTLTPEESTGCVERTDSFVADASIPAGSRAEVSDYAHSGYDKGHLAPDGDMSYSTQTEHESFLMSNMSPQLPSLNRGAWKRLESQERDWALSRKHNLTIYAGNIYKVGKSPTIGANKVVIPDALYKIIIDDVTGEVQAFYFSNLAGQPSEFLPISVTVSELERKTGISFPVPAGYSKDSIAFLGWPSSPASVIDAKRLLCKAKR